MRKFKRLLASLLAGVVTLTSVNNITSFGAADTNGTGYEENRGSNTPYNVGSFLALHCNQGVRLSIINDSGIVVSNLVDFVRYFPEDISRNIAEAEKVDREGIANLWGRYKNNTGSRKGTPKKFITYIGAAKTDPIYVTSRCLLDHNYTVAGDENNNGLLGIRRKGDYTREESGLSNIDTENYVNGRMYTYSLIEGLLTLDGGKMGYENPMDGTSGTHTYTSKAATGQQISVPKKLQPPMLEGTTSTGVGGVVGSGEVFKNQLMTPITIKGADGNQKEVTVLQRMLEMDAADMNGRGTLKSTNLVKMFEFIDPKLKEQYEEEVAKGNTENPMSTVFSNNNLRVAIEPVAWMVGGMASPTDPRGNNGVLGPNLAYSTETVIYSTVTFAYLYIAQQFYEESKKNNDYDDLPAEIKSAEGWSAYINWTKDRALGTVWEWGIHPNGYMLERDEPELNLVKYDKSTQNNMQDFLRYWGTLGYGVMLTRLDENGISTHTWDNVSFPSGDNFKPGPAPSTKKPDGSIKISEGENFKKLGKDNQYNIIKFYAEKQDDGTYKYIENFVRKETLHTVLIEDEPGYRVDSWFSSPTFKEPTSPTESYDTYKDSLPAGKYQGNSSGQLNVLPEDSDTTLYMRLVSEDSQLVVQKFFPGDRTTTEILDSRPSVYDANEPNYSFEISKQNPDKKTVDTWNDIPGGLDTGNNVNIPVKNDTKTIYIKYTQDDENALILYSNELSHTYTLEDINSLVTLTHHFDDMEYSGSRRHGSGDDKWYCDWYRSMSDDDVHYVISNHADFGSTSFMGAAGEFSPIELGIVEDRDTISIYGGDTNGLTPNLKFSVYRDKVKDNVTLYPGKNTDTIKNEIQSIGIIKEGYTPQTKRVLETGKTSWNSSIPINYAYDVNDNTVRWVRHGCSRHGGASSGSQNGSPGDLSVINSAFSNASLKTYAFYGEEGLGDQKSSLTSSPFSLFGKTFNKNLNYITFGEKYFSFYPYTKMKYETINDDTDKDVYVTSTNLSKVLNNSSVEVGILNVGNQRGISLDSEQWSTHSRTQSGLKANGVSGKTNDLLIPGGATVTLSTANTSNASEVWIGVRTYAMSIPDSLKSNLASTDGIKTTSEVQADSEQFIIDMQEILSHYQLEKWIKPGIGTSDSYLDSGASKVSGINPVGSFGGNSLNRSDSKYYLKTDGNGANSGKLDVLDMQKEVHVYNISADTNGRVSFKKDGIEIASDNIKADKNLNGLLSNSEIKSIDDRVKIVTNFIKSLDFEGDTDRDGKPWYYEAFDGLECVESLVIMQIGFGEESPIRSEVIDPRLCGKLDNKSDILNFNEDTLEEKTRTVQYRLSDRSTSSKANGKPNNYIGSFGGKDIILPGMNTVMRTKLHYMGNNTVTDLN